MLRYICKMSKSGIKGFPIRKFSRDYYSPQQIIAPELLFMNKVNLEILKLKKQINDLERARQLLQEQINAATEVVNDISDSFPNQNDLDEKYEAASSDNTDRMIMVSDENVMDSEEWNMVQNISNTRIIDDEEQALSGNMSIVNVTDNEEQYHQIETSELLTGINKDNINLTWNLSNDKLGTESDERTGQLAPEDWSPYLRGSDFQPNAEIAITMKPKEIHELNKVGNESALAISAVETAVPLKDRISRLTQTTNQVESKLKDAHSEELNDSENDSEPILQMGQTSNAEGSIINASNYQSEGAAMPLHDERDFRIEQTEAVNNMIENVAKDELQGNDLMNSNENNKFEDIETESVIADNNTSIQTEASEALNVEDANKNEYQQEQLEQQQEQQQEQHSTLNEIEVPTISKHTPTVNFSSAIAETEVQSEALEITQHEQTENNPLQATYSTTFLSPELLNDIEHHAAATTTATATATAMETATAAPLGVIKTTEESPLSENVMPKTEMSFDTTASEALETVSDQDTIETIVLQNESNKTNNEVTFTKSSDIVAMESDDKSPEISQLKPAHKNRLSSKSSHKGFEPPDFTEY